MKTISLPKVVITLITIALFAVVLKSCKKVDNTATGKTAETTKEAVIKAIKEKYGNVASSITYPVNKIAEELFYRDVADNNSMVKINKDVVSNGPNGILQPCFFNCTNTTDPNKLRIFYTLQSVQRTTYCRTNTFNWLNDISVNWLVSAPFTPLVADPNNASNLSTGSVLISPPFGPAYGANNISPIVIAYIGADPNCSANSIYKITYTYSYVVTDVVFTNGYPVDVSLSLYNNCSLVGNLVNSGVVSSTLAGKTAPCDRTDHVWLAGGGPGNCIIAAASYITGCSVPSGLTAPDLHQIEYRKVITTNGNLGWEEQVGSAIVYGYIPNTNNRTATMTTSSGFLNLLSMTPGSGTWLVRYRNIKFSICDFIGLPSEQTTPPATPNIWTGNWVTEVVPL